MSTLICSQSSAKRSSRRSSVSSHWFATSRNFDCRFSKMSSASRSSCWSVRRMSMARSASLLLIEPSISSTVDRLSSKMEDIRLMRSFVRCELSNSWRVSFRKRLPYSFSRARMSVWRRRCFDRSSSNCSMRFSFSATLHRSCVIFSSRSCTCSRAFLCSCVCCLSLASSAWFTPISLEVARSWSRFQQVASASRLLACFASSFSRLKARCRQRCSSSTNSAFVLHCRFGLAFTEGPTTRSSVARSRSTSWRGAADDGGGRNNWMASIMCATWAAMLAMLVGGRSGVFE
mmetsp:Transcript_69482/g.201321  ORF Transcript_69482/g.201321 Transcript_69482/m.201321 type:complete len:289 (-) Transcript_69482:53-919(-)